MWKTAICLHLNFEVNADTARMMLDSRCFFLKDDSLAIAFSGRIKIWLGQGGQIRRRRWHLSDTGGGLVMGVTHLSSRKSLVEMGEAERYLRNWSRLVAPSS